MSIILILAAAASAGCAVPQTQSAMTTCAANELRRADAALNRGWATTYGAMKRRDAADTTRGGGPGYASSLLLAQRAWLEFRDRQCIVEGLAFAGGTMQPLAIAECRTRMTVDRTGQLAALTKGHL